MKAVSLGMQDASHIRRKLSFQLGQRFLSDQADLQELPRCPLFAAAVIEGLIANPQHRAGKRVREYILNGLPAHTLEVLQVIGVHLDDSQVSGDAQPEFDACLGVVFYPQMTKPLKDPATRPLECRSKSIKFVQAAFAAPA